MIEIRGDEMIPRIQACNKLINHKLNYLQSDKTKSEMDNKMIYIILALKMWVGAGYWLDFNF